MAKHKTWVHNMQSSVSVNREIWIAAWAPHSSSREAMHLVQSKQDRIAHHKAGLKYEHRLLNISDSDSIKLRFALGTRVLCQTGSWKLGTVVQQFYHEPQGMRIGMCVPYQVHLDPAQGQEAMLIAVPFDEDAAIREVQYKEALTEGGFFMSPNFMSATQQAANARRIGKIDRLPDMETAAATRHSTACEPSTATVFDLNELGSLLVQMCLWGEDARIFEDYLTSRRDVMCRGKLYHVGVAYRNALNHAESTFLLTPLAAACRHGHADIVKCLLANGASVRVRDVVASGGYTPLHTACFMGNARCACVLLEHSASLLVETSSGCTPLMTAACEGQIACVEVMLGEHHMRSDDGRLLVIGKRIKSIYGPEAVESVLQYVNTALKDHKTACQGGSSAWQKLYNIADCLSMILSANAGQRHLVASTESRRLLKVVSRLRANPVGQTAHDESSTQAAAQKAEEVANALLAEEEKTSEGQASSKKKGKQKMIQRKGDTAETVPPVGPRAAVEKVRSREAPAAAVAAASTPEPPPITVEEALRQAEAPAVGEAHAVEVQAAAAVDAAAIGSRREEAAVALQAAIDCGELIALQLAVREHSAALEAGPPSDVLSAARKLRDELKQKEMKEKKQQRLQAKKKEKQQAALNEAILASEAQATSEAVAAAWQTTQEAQSRRAEELAMQAAAKSYGECSICMEDILSDHGIRGLDCSHIFHTACILEWISTSRLCPECRHPVS